jgi:hypothetical protein
VPISNALKIPPEAYGDFLVANNLWTYREPVNKSPRAPAVPLINPRVYSRAERSDPYPFSGVTQHYPV